MAADIDESFIAGVKDFVTRLRSRLPMYRDLVTKNMILRQRLEDVGALPLETCRRYGATGPVLRGSGQAYDVRRAEPYSVYDRFEFEIPTDRETDSMGRYRVRMAEMEQSLNIIEQAADGFPQGEYLAKGFSKPKWKAPAGEAYFAVEGARGKIGVHLVSDGTRNPYRCKLRSPSFSNMSLFGEISRGVLLSDAVAILGSLDVVIPEIDR